MVPASTTATESTKIRPAGVRYVCPATACGRFQRRNVSVMEPPAMPGQNRDLNNMHEIVWRAGGVESSGRVHAEHRIPVDQRPELALGSVETERDEVPCAGRE